LVSLRNIIFYISLIFISCQDKNFEYKVNEKLDDPFFESNIVKSFYQSNRIEWLISYNIKEHEKGVLKKYSNWKTFLAYKKNDTIFLVYDFNDNSNIKFFIFNNKYKYNISYSTDLQGTYSDGNEYGTYFEPSIKFHKLTINRYGLHENDTLKGYFKIITEPFTTDSIKISKEYEGYFVGIIKDLEIVRKYSP
jgi:hypothetical protein